MVTTKTKESGRRETARRLAVSDEERGMISSFVLFVVQIFFDSAPDLRAARARRAEGVTTKNTKNTKIGTRETLRGGAAQRHEAVLPAFVLFVFFMVRIFFDGAPDDEPARMSAFGSC